MTIRSTLGRFAIVTTEALRSIVAHPDGTSAVVAVYVVLMTHADREESDAWRCSIKSIADEAGVSERTVRMAKTVLKELGLIETTPNFTPDGDRAWDSYLMHFSPFQAPAESAPPPAESAPGDATVAAYSSDQEADQEADVLANARLTKADAFAEFWSAYIGAYGSKASGSKGAAFKVWQKMAKRDMALAMEAVGRQSRARTEQHAVPHASTWLNNCRWLDDELQVRPGRGPDRTQSNPFTERGLFG